MYRPKIKDSCDVVPETEGRFQIRSSEQTIVLAGQTVRQVFPQLLPLLDGEHTADAIIEHMRPAVSANLVHAVIEKLQHAGIVEDAALDAPADFTPEELARYQRQLAFFDVTIEEGTALDAQRRLKAARLTVVGNGELANSLAIHAARAGIGRICGLNMERADAVGAANPFISFTAQTVPLDAPDIMRQAATHEAPTLLAIALDRPEPALLETLNELAQDLNVALLHCRTHGTEGVVGPLVVPKQTACLTCYQLRVNSNLEFFDEYRTWSRWTAGGPARRAHPGGLPALTELVAGMAMLEIIKHVTACYEPETYSKYISVNALTLEVMPHQILKLPRCPSCGNAQSHINLSIWQEPR